MAGIYIHIPFCKTRCIYCDFYSTTRSELKSQYIRALCRELTERKEYLKGKLLKPFISVEVHRHSYRRKTLRRFSKRLNRFTE